MIRPLFLLLLFLVVSGMPRHAVAQGENNVWAFGDSIGVNFNTVPPTYFETHMSVWEGSAAVSDAAGSLLFYTSGGTTWDRNGNPMPNGQGLLGNGPQGPNGNTGSSMTGVAVVKSPSNEHQYYLIVTDAVEDQLYDAHYSVIDMTLNNGLGDVIPSQKDILLASGIAEGVVTTKASNCEGYWAVLHSRNGNNYYAFKIDAAGMHTTPVTSSGVLGVPGYANYAMMRFNNAGTRIARGFDVVEVGNFDRTTGMFSSFVSLQPNVMGGAIVFSPDDSKLYVGGFTGLVQFDMALMPNVTAMQAGQYTVLSTPVQSMRVGPDQKVYVDMRPINNPNAAGAACGFVNQSAVVFPPPPYTPSYFELGNPIVINIPEDTLVPANHYDTLCFQGAVTLNGVAGAVSYMWNNGAMTPQQQVSQDGLYWVRSFKNCVMHVDTFHIRLADFGVNLGNDTSICPGKPLVLDVTAPGAAYLWQDGSVEATYVVSGKGRYTVRVTKDGCTKTDDVEVDLYDPYVTLAEADTMVCGNRPFELHAEANPESIYTWNNGATGATISAADSGLYIVTAANICGIFSDSVQVSVMFCSCDAFVPNAFTPNGDGANDLLMARLNCPGMTQFVMRVYNRYGQRLFESNDADRGWDGMQNGKPVDVGTYFYYVQYKTGDGEVIRKKGDVYVIR